MPKPKPIKKAPLKPRKNKIVRPKVSQIVFKYGNLTYVLPKRLVDQITSFFPGSTIRTLTKIEIKKNRVLFEKLQTMPEKDFRQLKRAISLSNQISEIQQERHFKQTQEVVIAPFEDLFQTMLSLRLRPRTPSKRPKKN